MQFAKRMKHDQETIDKLHQIYEQAQQWKNEKKSKFELNIDFLKEYLNKLTYSNYNSIMPKIIKNLNDEKTAEIFT